MGLMGPGLPSGIGFDHLVLFRIHQHDRSIILSVDVSLGAIRQECYVAGTMADLKGLDNFARCWIEYGNRSGLLGGDVDELAVRCDFYSFRLLRRPDRLGYRAGRDIDHADSRVVFVRNVQLSSILADIEVLRVRASLE